MKIIFKGPVFNPTGIATANREMVKALVDKKVSVQVDDIWNDSYDFNKGLEHLNSAINSVGASTIFNGYPMNWTNGYGQCVGGCVHEGTRLPEGWAQTINSKVTKLYVPSKATKSLFRWNGVSVPIRVIPHGVDKAYIPIEMEKDKYFNFLSINSWTGEVNDRKGTDILVRAFDEEFAGEDVKLLLKISSFWQERPKDFYAKQIVNILGHPNPNIMVNEDYLPESTIVEMYQRADCFVAPTKGEGFGMTILNAKACGLPVVVTKDNNSGHMDFCEDDSTVWIKTDGVEQGDPRFFCAGNMQAKITVQELRKSMREAYERREELSKIARANSEKVRNKYTWENAAKKLIDFVKEEVKW